MKSSPFIFLWYILVHIHHSWFCAAVAVLYISCLHFIIKCLVLSASSILAAFKEMNAAADGQPVTATLSRLQPESKQRLSTPNLEHPTLPVLNKDRPKGKQSEKPPIMSAGHKTKIKKALQKFSLLPRNVNRYTAVTCSLFVHIS
jgi:hypothetical protein